MSLLSRFRKAKRSEPDGRTLESAIVVPSTDSRLGIAFEYQYLEDRFGKLNRGYRLFDRVVIHGDNSKVFDKFIIEHYSSRVEIYFEITSFHGKILGQYPDDSRPIWEIIGGYTGPEGSVPIAIHLPPMLVVFLGILMENVDIPSQRNLAEEIIAALKLSNITDDAELLDPKARVPLELSRGDWMVIVVNLRSVKFDDLLNQERAEDLRAYVENAIL